MVFFADLTNRASRCSRASTLSMRYEAVSFVANELMPIVVLILNLPLNLPRCFGHPRESDTGLMLARTHPT